MCGICGKINLNHHPISKELITQMTNSLSHRGPDDFGIYQTNAPYPVSLGHRRLCIIDLSQAGQQPMCNEEKNIWLVFNGEIYNHQAIRGYLLQKGHRFSSHTDSEVIIHLYEEHGIDCLKELEGMFALCIWDAAKQTLFLARDRCGIKPLVYFFDGQSLSFASEIRSLLCDPAISREIDLQALDLYLSLNHIPAPWSIYKNIKKLPPASYLKIQDSQMSIEPYWDITPGISNVPIDFNDAKKQLYELMRASVMSHAKADVPLGAFLSGGIDSAIVVGLLAQHAFPRLKTYSIGFKDSPFYDESSYAKLLAKHHGTEHTQVDVASQDMLDLFPELLNWFDEPFADSSAIASLLVCRETRKHIKVALSGDGGDELFAGYRMYQGEALYQSYKSLPGFIRRDLIEPLVHALPDSRDNALFDRIRRLKKFMAGASNRFEERFFLWNQILPRDLRQRLLHNPLINHDRAMGLLSVSLNQRTDDAINRMLYCDLKNSLANDMLNKVDWMSMKNGLEVRVPMLDRRIVEFAFSLPGDYKLRHGVSKYILKETFKDLLPKAILSKPKSGFEIPLSQWLKGPLKPLIHEHLSRDAINKANILAYEPIKALIDDHLSHRRDTSWQLWNLIVFQAWLKRSR